MNATHPHALDENRQQLVNAGAIPVLVGLLNSPDTDVQYYCTTALSNIAVDGANRKKLAQSEPKLVTSLVQLMDSQSLKVQCQAALALRNLASDGKYIPASTGKLPELMRYYREISIGDCKGRRPNSASPASSVQLSSSYSLSGSLRAERLYPPSKRVSHH